MIPLILSTTIISCSQAISLIYRINQIAILSSKQKTEIIFEIKKVIKSCPIKIESENINGKGSI